MTYTPPKPPEGYYWTITSENNGLVLKLKKNGRFKDKTLVVEVIKAFSYPAYVVDYEASKILDAFFGAPDLIPKDQYEGKYYYE